VGIVGAGTWPLRQPPSLTRSRVLGWLADLEAHARGDHPAEGTWLSQRLDGLAESLHQRCLVVVLSDLHDDSRGALRRLALRHDLAVIALRDAGESAAAPGWLDAREAESVAAHRLPPGARLTAPLNAADLRHDGLDAIELRSDAAPLEALTSFFAQRGRRRAR
jgi:hypothetical protein